MEVGGDGGAVLVVGLDVVVLEEGAGVAARVLAFIGSFVDDAALSSGGEASSWAGVDGLSLRIVEEQGHERVGEQGGDGVVGEWGAVGEGAAFGADVNDDFGGHGGVVVARNAGAGAGDRCDQGVGALLGE